MGNALSLSLFKNSSGILDVERALIHIFFFSFPYPSTGSSSCIGVCASVCVCACKKSHTMDRGRPTKSCQPSARRIHQVVSF